MYDGQNSPAAAWFAVQTKPKHEKSVSRFLEGKGYEQLLPLYQSWHRSSGRLQGVLLPLFKGYTFCHFDPLHRLPILMTPGVSGIIGRGRAPEPIPTEEITRIRESCASGLQIMPWPYLERGDLVRVECGPLQGVEGFFVHEKNTSRLVVSVQILRRSVAVEVDRNWVRPVGTRSDGTFMIAGATRAIYAAGQAAALPAPAAA